VFKDDVYCLKTYAESDFDKPFKGKFFSQLTRELYPNIKPSFDRIKKIQTGFTSPYSSELTHLINRHLPKTFTEYTPPFDMLEASIWFPEILSLLEKEQMDYIEKCKKEEQERIIIQRRTEEEEEQRRKEQQSRNWEMSGLCPRCGGRLSYRYYSGSWERKCNSCSFSRSVKTYEFKKIRTVRRIILSFVAISGALLLHNLFMLIPFAIIFFVPSDYYSPWGGFNGFFKFLRITTIIAMGIISIVVIIRSIGFPIITLGSIILGFILLSFACVMAFKQSFTGEYGL
jgi:uncharacterized protein (DUF983 family)